MIRRMSGPALAGLLLAFHSMAPVAAANREHQQMMADIRMLQEQSQQLQFLIGSLTEALKTVTAKLDEYLGNNRKAFADQKLLVDNISGDLRVVREKVDETNVRITSLSQELEALRIAIPATPSTPLPAPGGEGTSPGVGSAPPPSVTPPLGPGMSPQRLYETAQGDFMAGHWTLAIQGFETYIRTFPKSEMADDAQYYIGETYSSDGKYGEALRAYEQVISSYPSSNKLPETYYKRGFAFEQLRQPDRARESYEFVVKSYPDSDVGRLAKQRLDALRRAVR